VKTLSNRLSRTVRTAALAACTLTASCATPWANESVAAEAKPVVVVAVNSIDHLLEDANFIGSLVGADKVADQAKMQIAMMAPGLDTSKPMGLIVNLGEMAPSGALCLPTNNLKQMLGMLTQLGGTVEEKNGLLEISMQGNTVFAKQGSGWAFISMMPQMLEGLPADPSQLLGTLTNEYDLGVRLHVQNIPKQSRDQAIEQLQRGLEAGLQKQTNETDEAFEARKEMAQMQVEQIKRAISELDELTFGLAVDGKQQRTYLDIAYTAVPNTQLAEQLALNSNPTTNFAGFFQPDAAMMMTFASKASEADIAQFEQMFGALRKQVETAIDEQSGSESEEELAVIKSAVNDFMDALRETVKGGMMDGGAVFNLAPNSATFVAGGFVGDPSKVEAGLKKLAGLAEKQDSDFPGVKWNADSHAGVAFHTVSGPIQANEKEARQLFGDTMEIAVGIGEKSVYFALGRDCVAAAKDIIDKSASNPGKAIAPMEMTIALKQIMEVAAATANESEKADIKMIADMLGQTTEGRDHVRIVVQPITNGARIRIEAEEGVLKAIGMAGIQAGMESAGSPPGGF
jgi:hypothetical protein